MRGHLFEECGKEKEDIKCKTVRIFNKIRTVIIGTFRISFLCLYLGGISEEFIYCLLNKSGIKTVNHCGLCQSLTL